jgi:hypothetical protein
MVTRYCVKCETEKYEQEFNWKIIGKRRRTDCKSCQAKYHKIYWSEHKEQHIKSIRNRDKKNRKLTEEFIVEYLKLNSCVDCGNENILVLEFDHVKGEKRGSIANLIKRRLSWKTVRKEIEEKCVVRCSNCHLIRHTYEQQRWKLKYI